jgi:cytochrome c-type biogenesis protein CcmF
MFAGKLGYVSLIFSFLFSIFVLYFSYKDIKSLKSQINNKIYTFSLLQVVSIYISFICLIYSFIISDFSLLSVYENSHTNKPLFYKISGTWGNHEGSLLLWLIVLILFSYFFLINSTNSPKKYRLQAIILQNIIVIGFLSFSILTSNPFAELIPVPKQGLGLNPILQDPILAIHPPILYIGYVGSSIIFSSALAAMLNKYISINWAKSIKPWIFFSWTFLTLGILLGSIWAYYELGWGGFWFWDPVENISLMPWLALTALLHTIIILEKRGIFKSWTAILSIITFILSTVGTFLVRSGILNSVHTFASDPSRGLYILSFLIILSFISLLIFFWYQPIEKEKSSFSFLSKETFLLINNWFMVFFLLTVLIGTIYPIFLEVVSSKKISVGAPFYNFIIIPFIIPFLLFMSIGPNLKWMKTNIFEIKKDLFFLFLITCFLTLIIYYLQQNLKSITVLIIFVSLILITSVLIDFYNIYKNKDYKKNKFKLGRLISHIGFGLLVLSIGLNTNLSLKKSINLKIGESDKFSNYKLIFKDISEKNKENYKAIIGKFFLIIDNNENIEFNPEIRIYDQPKTITSEVSINSSFFSDYYLTMSYIENENYFNINFQHKPFMMWIWISFILISIGGFFGVFVKKK